jgi:hypothetical protein
MKRRGLASPDRADALALTFARVVFPRGYEDWHGTAGNVISEYDPFQESCLRGEPPVEAKKARYYAPGWEWSRLKSDDWSSDDLGDAMQSDRLRWAKQDEEGC